MDEFTDQLNHLLNARRHYRTIKKHMAAELFATMITSDVLCMVERRIAAYLNEVDINEVYRTDRILPPVTR